MEPPSRSPPPAAARDPAIIVEERAWRRHPPHLQARLLRAARAAGGAGCIVLSGDRQVKRLNAAHRNKAKPTNVLTFDAVHSGGGGWIGGDIVLAFGTVSREARAQRRSIAAHATHLVVHGALHLRGHDHQAPGEARRMELAEARILHRLGTPNPWKPRAGFGS